MSQKILLSEDVRVFMKNSGKEKPHQLVPLDGQWIRAGSCVEIGEPEKMTFASDGREREVVMVTNEEAWEVCPTMFILLSEIGKIIPCTHLHRRK